MRRFVLGGALVLVAACASGEREPAADTTAASVAPTVTPTMSLASMAGRWDMTNRPESATDTVPTRYTLTTTPDTAGWSLTFPNRRTPVPVRVVLVDGDSVVTEAGPYESVRRRGVQVTTRSGFRMDGDRLVGSTRARYSATGADTVLVLQGEGTRLP